MELETLLKMLAALKHAPEVKKALKENHGPCWSHESYCSCSRNELCNIALAAALRKDPGNVLRQWRKIVPVLGEAGVLEARKIPAPGNRPRRYLQLAPRWHFTLAGVVEKIYAEKIKPQIVFKNNFRGDGE